MIVAILSLWQLPSCYDQVAMHEWKGVKKECSQNQTGKKIPLNAVDNPFGTSCLRMHRAGSRLWTYTSSCSSHLSVLPAPHKIFRATSCRIRIRMKKNIKKHRQWLALHMTSDPNRLSENKVVRMDHSPGCGSICCLAEEKWSARKQLRWDTWVASS